MARASYHHGNLRSVLVDAALALVAERGDFGFTMRELSRAAGVTHNAPYRHFADKDALLAAIAADGFALLSQRSRRTRSDRGRASARARIAALGESYVRFAVEHPHRFRLMFGETTALAMATHPALAEAAAASFAELRDAIAHAEREGSLRRGVSVDEATTAAWSLVHGLASLLVAGHVPRRAAPAQLRAIGKVFFDGALATDARSGTRRRRAATTDRSRP